LRIISGQARGRKFFAPGKGKGIRPTSDRAREALFSIIGSRVQQAYVLDLYAGTGALGLEALSRGASQVSFVELHQNSLELIRRNCSACLQSMNPDTVKRVQLVKHDLRRGITSNLLRLNEESRFDLIFLDPPYGHGLAENSLLDLDKSELCDKNVLIIAEESSIETLPAHFPNGLTLGDIRKYGEATFWFYTFEKSKGENRVSNIEIL